jgi:GH15 family glucan-1,4-alpha-glucosidase
MDVYGEVIDAVSHFCHEGGRLDRETQKMLRGFGEFVCRHWTQPDEGIWEPRSGRAHNTHSRVLCWTALDRLLRLRASGRIEKVPVEMFADHRERIEHEVVARAWSSTLDSYVAQLDGDTLDAGLLLLPWYAFEAPTSTRMRRTYARIRERLGAGGPLLYRNEPGTPPREGAFGICSFWAAEYLALGGGSVEEATDAFERLVRYGNDLGLFAEEIDPSTGANLGNFPQAFTHVGLINAALSLDRRARGLSPVGPGSETDHTMRPAAGTRR